MGYFNFVSFGGRELSHLGGDYAKAVDSFAQIRPLDIVQWREFAPQIGKF